jgi:hypothetical protein
MLGGLLHRQARQSGLDLSPGEIRRELADLREVVTFHLPADPARGGRPRLAVTYTESSPVQKQLAAIFGLDALRAR